MRAGRNPPWTPVWHTSIRNHVSDRTLSDAQWAHIAAEIVAAVGIAPHGDPDAVRWVAVRHAADHIHIVATLVRQDGRTVWAWNERIKAQAAARDLEKRYGLFRVGPTDGTSHHRPNAAEQNKTARQGRSEVPRDRLRRDVRAAAAAAINEADFFTRLRAIGVLVRLRYSTINANEVTGYAVGLPDHRTASGDTVWYGGGRLAPDLTLPQLRRRWDAVPESAPRPSAHQQQRSYIFHRAAAAARKATQQLAGCPIDDDPSMLISAAADVLNSTARAAEGRSAGPMTTAAETFDHAARQRLRRAARRFRVADELRALSRLIAVMGRLTDDHDTAAALQLVLQIAMFAENLADLRESQNRLHQARSARRTAEQLRTIAAAGPTTAPHRHPAAGPDIPRRTSTMVQAIRTHAP